MRYLWRSRRASHATLPSQDLNANQEKAVKLVFEGKLTDTENRQGVRHIANYPGGALEETPCLW